MDIQKALVSTKYDTYTDLVEYAQRVETMLGKVKTRKTVKKSWTGSKGTPAQEQLSRPPQKKFSEPSLKKDSGPPQKRASEGSVAVPAKRINLPPLCPFCGKDRHEEKDCWKKAGECLRCDSSEHLVRDCPSTREYAKPLAIAQAP